MKKVLLALALTLSVPASAHQFWPDDYKLTLSPGTDTMLMTHVRSQEDGYYKFTLNGIPLGDEQIVFANTTTDFPVLIPHGIIEEDTVLMCAKALASEDTMEKEVCLKIQVYK